MMGCLTGLLKLSRKFASEIWDAKGSGAGLGSDPGLDTSVVILKAARTPPPRLGLGTLTGVLPLAYLGMGSSRRCVRSSFILFLCCGWSSRP